MGTPRYVNFLTLPYILENWIWNHSSLRENFFFLTLKMFFMESPGGSVGWGSSLVACSCCGQKKSLFFLIICIITNNDTNGLTAIGEIMQIVLCWKPKI